MSGKVAASGINGRGGDSLSETPKIEHRYGECDVTITFKEKAEDVKDDVLWLMLENYKEHLSQKMSVVVSGNEDKRVG